MGQVTKKGLKATWGSDENFKYLIVVMIMLVSTFVQIHGKVHLGALILCRLYLNKVNFFKGMDGTKVAMCC